MGGVEASRAASVMEVSGSGANAACLSILSDSSRYFWSNAPTIRVR